MGELEKAETGTQTKVEGQRKQELSFSKES